MYQWQGQPGDERIQHGSSGIVARVWYGNPRDAQPDGSDVEMVCWSGWLGEADPETGWFESTAATWLGQGLEDRARVVGELVSAGVIIRPHARHLVNDIPTCLNVLRAFPQAKLLIEPGTLLEPSMVEASDEHIERIVEGLCAQAWGVVLGNMTVREDPRGDWCCPIRADEGLLDMDHLRRCVEAAVGPEVRIIERD